MFQRMFYAAFAAIALVGCNEKNIKPVEVPSGDKVQLTVNLPENLTKLTGVPTDSKINDVQIFVFDRNGLYETSSHGNASTISLTCTTGEKHLVALVNAPLEESVSNLEDLRSRTSDLSSCSAGNLVMSGETPVELTASTTVTMEVTRLAAKVALESVVTAFENEVHRNLPFEVKAVYLVNVAGDRSYLKGNAPTKWYNKGAYMPQSSLDFLYDAVTAGQITSGGNYSAGHFFYCYPNSTTTKTRLVVETQIGGYTYYYPVTLDSVTPNTAYTYNLTITRLGSDSPNEPVADGAVSVTLTVKDWTECEVNETI